MKTMTSEELRLDIIINGDQGRKALLDLEDGIKKNKQEVEKYRQQLAIAEKQQGKNSSAYIIAKNNLDTYKNAVKQSEAALLDMRESLSLNSMTMSALQRHSTKLRAALLTAVPGTQNWKNLSLELNATRNRLSELYKQSETVKTSLCKMSETFNKYIQSIAGIGYTAFKVINLARRASNQFLEYDEALVDAMKTTGLTREQIENLSAELKKIDTKTAQNELLSLVRIGGKLGISGEEDLMGFVKAADKINVALKKDLGGDTEGALAAIGKLVDVFKLKEDFGLEKAMLKVGSAINTLGMASTANEGYIVNFASRLAGLAPNANIAIDKILGLAGTLDSKAIQAETSATAIGQTIMAMFKRTEAFAGIAKMSVEDFSNLLKTDVNEAFLRVLEGMKSANGGLDEVVDSMTEMHLNGQRASQVLGALAADTAALRMQQALAKDAFDEGTSVIEEFNLKNESATAIMEKHKNAIHNQVVEIGEKFLPVVNGAMDLAEVGITTISKLVGLLAKHKIALIMLAAIYTTLNASKKLSVFWDKHSISWAKVKKFWSLENRLAIELETKAMTKQQIELGALKTKTILLAAAKSLLTGNVKAAGHAFKLLGTSIKASMGIVGIALLAIEGLAAAFFALTKSSRETKKAIKESNKALNDSFEETQSSINKESRALETLKQKMLDAKEGTDERTEALKELNKKYKDYLPYLLTEESSNNEIAAAIAAVNEELERNILLKGKANEIERIANEEREAEKKAFNQLTEAYSKQHGGSRMLIEDQKKLISALQTGMNIPKTLQDVGIKLNGRGGVYDTIISLLNQKRNFRDERKLVDTWYAEKPSKSSAPAADGEWSLKTDKEHMKAAVKLKKAYRNGEIESETEFQKQLLDLEIKAYQDRISLEKDTGENLLKLQKELSDKMSQRSLLNKTDGEGGSGYVNKATSAADDQWSLSKDEDYLKKAAALKAQYANGEIKTEKDLNRKLLELEIQSYQNRINLNTDTGTNLQKLQNELQDRRVKLRQIGEKAENQWSLETNASFLEKRNNIQKEYDDGLIASKEEYDDKILALEIETLNERIQTLKDKGEETLNLERTLERKREQQYAAGKKRNKAASDYVASNSDARTKENSRYNTEITSLNYGKSQVAENTPEWEAYNKAIEIANKKHQNNLNRITLDGINEREKLIEAGHKRDIAENEAAFAQQIAEKKLSAREKFRLKKEHQAAMAQQELDYAKNLSSLLTELQAQENTLLGEIYRTDIKYTEEEKNQLETDLANLQQRIAEMKSEIVKVNSSVRTTTRRNKDTGEQETVAVGTSNATETHSLYEGIGGGNLFGVSQEQWQQFFDNLEQGKFGAEGLQTAVTAIGTIAQDAMGIASKAIELTNAKENAAFKEYQKQNAKKKKGLEDRLNAGLMTQAQYDAEVARMEEEEAARQEEMELKQAKRQKAMSLTQAIINTALSITSALTAGFPMGIIAAGIAAAMGAVEIAMIAAQPITTGYAQGGLIETTRSQDGKRYKAHLDPDARGFVNGPTVLVGEDGEEYVIPADGIANPTLRPFISTIETARRNGTLKSLNFDAVYPRTVAGRVAGGFVSDTSAPSSQPANASTTVTAVSDPALTKAIERLIDKLDDPIPAYVTMMGKNGIIEQTDKYNKLRRRGRL